MQARKQASKQGSKQAIKEGSKEVRKQESKQGSMEGRNQGSKQGRKAARKQARKEASKEARKQAINHAIMQSMYKDASFGHMGLVCFCLFGHRYSYFDMSLHLISHFCPFVDASVCNVFTKMLKIVQNKLAQKVRKVAL